MIGYLLDPLQRFCSSMNMPSYMGDATYKSHVISLLKAATEAAEGSMKNDELRGRYERIQTALLALVCVEMEAGEREATHKSMVW